MVIKQVLEIWKLAKLCLIQRSLTIQLCPCLPLDLLYCRAEIEEEEMDTLVNIYICYICLSIHPSLIVLYPGEGHWGLVGGGVTGHQLIARPAYWEKHCVSLEPFILRRMSGDYGRKLESLDWTHSARRTCRRSRKNFFPGGASTNHCNAVVFLTLSSLLSALKIILAKEKTLAHVLTLQVWHLCW